MASAEESRDVRWLLGQVRAAWRDIQHASQRQAELNQPWLYKSDPGPLRWRQTVHGPRLDGSVIP